MRLIVTGCSGFIGFHCCNSLLNQGHEVIGIDNISNYYSTKLKNDRLTILNQFESFNFFKHDLKKTLQLELKREVDVFIHLAAQPGVRLPLTEYYRYDLSNILGFSNILNFISNFEIKNLIFASSSSVYGGNTNPVFSETDSLDPKSYYALTKLHNENTAKIFSLERNMNIVGLRFFTVYGPFGRPDMAYFSFLESLYKNEDINLFNNGLMFRDMTYITDIIDGIMRTIEFMRSNDNIFEIFNLGNDTPIQTIELLNKLENLSGSKAKIINLDSSGEVKHTHADLSKSRKLLGYDPKVDLNQGLYEFHEWYKSYFVK